MHEFDNIKAQAHLHHAYFSGLQLMVSTTQSPAVANAWITRLYRRQHQQKFLSSFEKLGLTGLPHAVACAQYHVMSNNIGGVPVEYMYESDRKAWVRFRYPRWIYQGPVLCGLSIEFGRGFLSGWYAQNGVSLNNPRLGFVCVSEDVTGEYGLCGYFKEYDYELSAADRLTFAKNESPPPYKIGEQPLLPSESWSEQRLCKANRNYAVEFVRNGIVELLDCIGKTETIRLAGRAARLIGMQYLQETMHIVDSTDGDNKEAAKYLVRMLGGLGDEVEIQSSADEKSSSVLQKGTRIVQGLEGEEREVVLESWLQLWVGAMSSYQRLKTTRIVSQNDQLLWTITDTL